MDRTHANELFKQEISKWPTDQLIKTLSSHSKRYIQNDELSVQERYSYVETFPTVIYPFSKKIKFMIPPWSLSSLEYYAIMYSNDFRDSRTKTLNKLVKYLYASDYDEMNKLDFEENPQKAIKLMFGVGSEQFKVQLPLSYFGDFNRNIHIFNGSKIIHYNLSKSLDDIFLAVTNMNFFDYITAIMTLFICCMGNIKPMEGYPSLVSTGKFAISPIEQFESILHLYTASYEEIRLFEYGRKIFDIKPFIRTQKDKSIILSSFPHLYNLFGNGVYWIVRKFYAENQQHLQEFPNSFGPMFEEYIMEFASYFKFPISRLSNPNFRLADFLVEIDDYVIIIEAKSQLLSLVSKSQSPSISGIQNFIERGMYKGLSQIESTVNNYCFSDKKILSLLLFFENLDALDLLIPLEEPRLQQHNTYPISISTFEKWVMLYSEDLDLFKAILPLFQYSKDVKQNGFAYILNEEYPDSKVFPIKEWNYFSKLLMKICPK